MGRLRGETGMHLADVPLRRRDFDDVLGPGAFMEDAYPWDPSLDAPDGDIDSDPEIGRVPTQR